jgi:hypothetical protein
VTRFVFPAPCRFVVYFVSKLAADSTLVVGAAASVTSSPLGPYTDRGAPLVLPPAGACFGVIDPTFYHDAAASQSYVIFKHDGNSCDKPTGIYAAALSSDGLNVTGLPQLLITDDTAWEHGITEVGCFGVAFFKCAPRLLERAITLFMMRLRRRHGSCATLQLALSFSSTQAPRTINQRTPLVWQSRRRARSLGRGKSTRATLCSTLRPEQVNRAASCTTAPGTALLSRLEHPAAGRLYMQRSSPEERRAISCSTLSHGPQTAGQWALTTTSLRMVLSRCQHSRDFGPLVTTLAAAHRAKHLGRKQLRVS